MTATLTLPEQPPAMKAESKNLSFYYGSFRALKGVTMPVFEHKVTALIGPSGCGKSTYLRCYNRMHDLYPGNRYDGSIELHPDEVNVLHASVDPIATGSIEELIGAIKDKVTILIVTHNMQQAARVSDFVAYMYLGELIEFGETREIFMKPKRRETEDYITGRFG
jgi:ABC-type phosphate transport system ATPase subunit